jgi:hypothetical protein
VWKLLIWRELEVGQNGNLEWRGRFTGEYSMGEVLCQYLLSNGIHSNEEGGWRFRVRAMKKRRQDAGATKPG